MKEYESHNDMVSHGICPDCLRGLTGVSTEIDLRDFLDKLDIPVLITDGSLAVQQGNRMAEIVFQRSSSYLKRSTVGGLIECYNAQGAGECGRSEQCTGCILRRTIKATHNDGQPRYGTYSDKEVMTPTGVVRKRLLFSTSRVGEVVMLAIEEVQDLQAAS
jgi:transcriptional regulator of aromatic amino acid metabolism